jgi:hypothetical protein
MNVGAMDPVFPGFSVSQSNFPGMFA